MSSFMKIAALVVVASPLTLAGCMAASDDTEQTDGASSDALCTYTEPAQSMPCPTKPFNPPTFAAPEVPAPLYPAPHFGAPTHEAPVYKAALQVSTPPQADEFTGNGVLGADAGTVVMEQSPGGTEAVKLIR